MRAFLVALAGVLVLTLAACEGGDTKPSSSPTDPVKVELGKEVTWNDFTVESGWQLSEEQTTIAMEQSTQPVITGDVTNDADKPRFAVFQITFVRDGGRLASLHCTSDAPKELKPGASSTFHCPGFGQVFPKDYDTIQVGPITRD